MMINHLNPFTAADADAMLALFDAHDDDIDLNRHELTILLAIRIAESNSDDALADAFLASHDICPMHRCDIQICADDDEPDCIQYR